MQLLDFCDQAEADDSGKREKKDEYREKLEHILSRIGEFESIEKQVMEEGEASLTDPDSRLMKMNNGGCGVCHNVQIAVDSKHHLVVAVDVVNDPGDKQQLAKYGFPVQTGTKCG